MSTLLLGSNFAGESAMDEDDVRSTVTVIDNESATATAEREPEFNTMERDPDTEGGLTDRNVSDYVTPSERWIPNTGNANRDFAAPINSQVSTSGTAAERELAGHWGHGSARWSDATEPTIREGNKFEDTYFSANRPPIQDGSMDYMLPSRTPDSSNAQDSQVAAKAAAVKAANAAMYQRFMESRTA